MNRGGARVGAGRKPRAEKFARPIAAAEKRIADRLPELVDNLLLLAAGGIEQVEERYEPAGLVQVDDYEEVQREGRRSRQHKVKRPAYPKAPAEQMVLVERRVTHTLPDRAALQYLIDRILGRTTSRMVTDVTSGGEPLKLYAGVDLDRV